MRDIGLLPCPFCGSSAVYLNSRPRQISWVVECAGCRARGPEVHTDRNTGEDRETAIRRAKTQASESWNNNRRTADVIKEWMDKKPCCECGVFFNAEDLTDTEYGEMCPDCYREMKEVEAMLQ